ncbi:MAG TPA: glycosyltransferase family 39 protein [Acidimicrobiales bacterium]|jgi:hypothetical protein|nr:glycosyltransferase family 39 protein [Acidimicrobiales bacterium]
MSDTAQTPGRARWKPPPSGLPQPAPRPRTEDHHKAAAAVVVVGLLVAVGFVWTMLVGSYDQYAAVLVAIALIGVTVPLARHAARLEARPAMTWIIMAAMLLRLGGSIARYVVAYGLYGGVADASTYTTVATNHYQAFRHLHLFMPGTGVFNGLVPFIDTVIYALVGPTELGAFLVFSWISFVGCYLFYRAFRIAFPEGDGRRYALLVLFLPSMLYWPSSLGKEAWMVFALGLASYGLARALAGRFGGYLALVAGIGAMLLVRPHLALIFLPAAVISFLLRRSTAGKRRPVGRLIGIAVLVISSLVVVSKAQSYFGITSLDVQSVTKELNTTRTQTAIGNSAFSPPNARSPTGYPEAAITVLYRPFPFESHSAAVLVASGEGLVLLGLTLVSWRRLRSLPRMLWRNPYLVFALLYSALFVLAFANFSNFGILARERVQMFPMFMVLLAIPAVIPRSPPKEAPAAVAGEVVVVGGARRRPSAPPRALPASRQRPAPGLPVPAAPAPLVGSAVLGPYRALDHHFEVEVGEATTTGAGVLADVSAALADLADPDAGPGLAAVHRHRLVPGGAPTSPGATSMVRLMAEVNRAAVMSRPDHLVVHAGAVALNGQGLLLPGPPGAGKTTLVGALVSAGCSYLTDEAAAIDPATLAIDPYPKPLSVDSDAWEALGYPRAVEGDRSGAQWFVPASSLAPEAAGRCTPARLLVFPRYDRAGATVLAPMSRAEALVELANNSFNFVDHGGAWLGLLRQVVLGCWCWRLTVADLDSACGLVVRLTRLRAEVAT